MEKYKCLNKMSEKGFSLIEMLIVLSVLSILLFLVVPLQLPLINKLEEEQFLERFKEDVLLVQNQASLNSKERMYIRFYEGHYDVVHGRNPKFAERQYPAGWKFSGSNNLIQFKETGTILGARTILMFKDDERIAFVFPPGKGRFYIDQD